MLSYQTRLSGSSTLAYLRRDVNPIGSRYEDAEEKRGDRFRSIVPILRTTTDPTVNGVGLGGVFAAAEKSAIAMVAGIQVTLALTRLKRTQEHGSGLAHEPDFVLRSRTYLYRLAPLTSPLNINYHFEHHANFNVPWYLLPDYHNVMRRIVPEELQPYIFHSRYLDQAAGRFPCIPAQLREQFGIEALPAGALSK